MSANLHDLDQFFRDETIRALFAQTAEDLRSLYEAEGRAVVYQAFALHDLADDVDRTYASVAAQLGISVPQVTNHLHAARKRFRERALARLRSLTGTDEEFRSEARDLFGVEVDV